jgi:hypothetical protein
MEAAARAECFAGEHFSRIVFGVPAPIGRTLGYRAIHPEYSPAEIARSRPTPSQRDRTR